MQLIQQYHADSKARKKKAEHTRDLNDHLAAHPAFEDFALKKIPLRGDGDDYVASCIKTFNLTEGLPTDITQ